MGSFYKTIWTMAFSILISLWKSLLPSERLLKIKKLIPPKAYLNELQQQGLA